MKYINLVPDSSLELFSGFPRVFGGMTEWAGKTYNRYFSVIFVPSWCPLWLLLFYGNNPDIINVLLLLPYTKI